MIICKMLIKAMKAQSKIEAQFIDDVGLAQTYLSLSLSYPYDNMPHVNIHIFDVSIRMQTDSTVEWCIRSQIWHRNSARYFKFLLRLI